MPLILVSKLGSLCPLPLGSGIKWWSFKELLKCVKSKNKTGTLKCKREMVKREMETLNCNNINLNTNLKYIGTQCMLHPYNSSTIQHNTGMVFLTH